MQEELIFKVLLAGRKASKIFGQMSPEEKAQFEDVWDVEHAYYSSALEGCKLDKKDFEQIGALLNRLHI